MDTRPTQDATPAPAPEGGPMVPPRPAPRTTGAARSAARQARRTFRRTVYLKALRPTAARTVAASADDVRVLHEEAADVETPLLPSLPLLQGFEQFRSDVQVTPKQAVVYVRDVIYLPEFEACVHRPTRRLLSDGLTSSNNRLPAVNRILGKASERIEGAAVPYRTNSIGYAHSLLDDIPRALLADQLVPSHVPLAMLYKSPLHNIERFIFDHLLSPRCRLVAVDPTDSYLLADAWIPSTVTGGRSLHPPAWYSDLLDRQIEARSGEPGPARLILSRGSALRRRMINEQALEKELSGLGFKTIDLGTMSIDEQIRALRSAEVIVSPHGAALGNLIWTRGARVVEIFPNAAVQPAFYILAASLGLDWRYVLGSGSDRHSDFEVPVEQVRKLIEA